MLALVLALLSTQAGGAVSRRTLESRLVDPMEAVGDWRAGTGGGALSATLAPAPGCTGRAVRLEYDLGAANGAWAQLRRDFDPPLDLSAFDHLRFSHFGTAPNTLEVGLVTADGAIYFAGSWPRSTHAGRCTYATWDLGDFRRDGRPLVNRTAVKAIFVSVVGAPGDAGGSGSLALDELWALRLAERSVPAAEAPAPEAATLRRAASWIGTRQRASGLVDSWLEEAADTAWLYDQALALLVLAETDPGRAARLAAAVRGLQNADGSWFAGYDAAAGAALTGDRPVGAVAWMAYALARYGARSGVSAASQAARRGAGWLASLQRADGSVPGIPGDLGAPAEANLDAWWALRVGGYRAQADRLRSFLLGRIWDAGLGRFRAGPDDGRIFLDNQTFGAAFLRALGRSSDARRALSYARANLATAFAGGHPAGLDGAGPFGVWNEGTLQYVSQRGGGSRLYWQEAASQQAPDGGMPGSPDDFSGYVVWLTPWHGVAPTAWLYFAATGGPWPG